jgi:hypothetical protein
LISEDAWDVYDHRELPKENQLDRLKVNEIYEALKGFVELKNVNIEVTFYTEDKDKQARQS